MDRLKQYCKKMLFYFGMAMFCIPTFLQMSMLVETPVLSRFFAYARYSAFAASFLLIGWNLAEKRSWKKIAWCGMILCLTGISSLISGDRTLLGCVSLVMASEEIEFEKILKINFLMILACFSLVLLLSKTGTIPDMMFKRQDIPERHALGFNYPSTVMSGLFSLVVMYVWLHKMKITADRLLLIEAINFLIYYLTDSRLGFLIITVLLVFLFLWNIVSVKSLLWRCARKAERILKLVSDWFALWMAVLTILMAYGLPAGLTEWLDRILTKRLQYIVSGIRNYGIHPLGKRIEWIGFGGSYDTDSLLETYNFVDNSYIWVLLNYGVVMAVLVLAMLVFLSKRVWREYPGGTVILILFYLLYCFAEPRLVDIYANPFLFLASPLLCGEFRPEKLQKKKR